MKPKHLDRHLVAGAAVLVMNPASSVLVDRTRAKLKIQNTSQINFLFKKGLCLIR